MSVILSRQSRFTISDDHGLFEQIANNLTTKGYSIHPNGLQSQLRDNLYQYLKTMPDEQFKRAGIGRETDLTVNDFVRTDAVCWINGDSAAGQQWLDWAQALQQYLNRRLFLGLFSFESHFSHYAPGDFYKKHCDAFRGQANRVVTIVLYLNPNWDHQDGGELVMFDHDDNELLKVTPGYGTLVVFLSEEFPHEVLPASRDRYSIAGWFRVNASGQDKVDPPR